MLLLLPSIIRSSSVLQSSSQHSKLALLAVLSGTQLALQLGVSTAHLLTPSGSHQLTATRAASSKSRGRKYPPHIRGYDRLLHQWADMTAAPSNSSKMRSGKAPRSHSYAKSKVSQQQNTSRKRHRTSSSDWEGNWYDWQDVDMAEAAAAAHLHPDELHNLVFGRSSSGSSSSFSSKGKSKRQQRKEARRRAKTLRKQAAEMGGAYTEFGFAWDEAESSDGPWYVSDSDSSSDDEYMAGAYSYHTAGSNQWHQRWQEQRRQQQPDWQWWSEEQERQWFQQAWQQHAGGQAGSSQQQQQQHRWHNDEQGTGSTYHRPWWERFEQQHRQSHKQGRQQRQQWRHWGYGGSSSAGTHSSSSSTGTGTGVGADNQGQGSTPAHPPSILQHLSVLGLPSTTQLHKQQLKVAFHKAAMQWHPDKHPDTSAKTIAEAKFKEVKAAYETLVQHVRA